MGEIREPHRLHEDFLGAFALIRDGERFLMVQNQRRIGGQLTLTWDLPGGQVERGELLDEALARELQEELGVEIAGRPELAFVQEGERIRAGVRSHAWRSFFFHVPAITGQPRAQAEVLAARWIERADLPGLLTAPYQQSFLDWLAVPRPRFFCRWSE